MRFRLFALALVAATLVSGCGKSLPEEENREINVLVSSASETINKKHQVGQLFVADAVPKSKDELAKFSKYRFKAKKVSVDGDRATIAVEVTDKDWADYPDVEWTAVRDGGRWKIASVQVP